MHRSRQWIWAPFLIIWMLTCAGTIPNGFALDIDPQTQLDYADHLFENQQYLRAAEEYQRFAFFFRYHPEQPKTLYKAGKAFLLAGDASTALARFKELANQPESTPLTIDANFMMVECYLNLNAPTQATVQLHNIIAMTGDRAIEDRAYHRLGWLYINYADWPAAQRAFSQVSPTHRRHYRTDEVAALLEKTSSIPRKSPTLAGTLSIIPGAGQLYCQRYEDALIAFLVNVGLFWAAGESFQEDQPALGGLLTFIGIGFYSGNIYGAISDAHKYNHNQQRQVVDQLNHYQVRETAGPPQASAKGLFFSLHIPF